MKFVAQRVLCATLTVNGQPVSEIGRGLVVYFGVRVGDTQKQAEKCAEKIARLRIFEDEAGKMNRSVLDAERGNRPSFTEAERPEKAEPLYRAAGAAMESLGVPVKYGIFGADMKIEQTNDGPVTIVYEN